MYTPNVCVYYICICCISIATWSFIIDLDNPQILKVIHDLTRFDPLNNLTTLIVQSVQSHAVIQCTSIL